MPRIISNTVDYFNHECKHGKTLFILEQRFNNDGYAFWFKLLELLGDTENHFYDANSPDSWQYLLAFTKVNEITGTEIINTLVSLGKLDSELWQKRKIIWCENLVKGFSDVYKKRGRPLPIKPDINSFSVIQYPLIVINNPISATETNNINKDKEIIPVTSNPITVTDIPHSIVKDSIVEESIIKDSSDKKSGDPQIKEILNLMISHLKTIQNNGKDPIPIYGQETTAIKRMIKRGFEKQDIFNCWKSKVDYRKEFVSMSWVNKDIGDWLSNGRKFKFNGNGHKERVGNEDEQTAIAEYKW